MFKYKEELLAEFAGIQNPSGTRIIIFNVRTTPDGKPEFDFGAASDDIRIPEDTDLEISKLKRQERQNHIPESDYSLRVSNITFLITVIILYSTLTSCRVCTVFGKKVKNSSGDFQHFFYFICSHYFLSKN